MALGPCPPAASQRASPPHSSARLLRQQIEAELHSAWLHTEAEAWGDAAAHGARVQRLLRGWRDACGCADANAAPAQRRRCASAGTEGEDADGGPCAALLAVRAEEAHAGLLLLQPRRGHGGCATAEAATGAAGTSDEADEADAADAADTAADEARALAALLSSARALRRLRRVAPRLAAAAAAATPLPLTTALTASPPTASPSTASAIDAARSLLPLRGLLTSRLAAALHALSAPVAARRWHERSAALVRCGGGVL